MRLFVYGTLLADSSTAPARWLLARTRSAQPGMIPGRLIAISTRRGWYPALVKGACGDRVCGVVCDLHLHRGDVARLDRYEGAEYRRVAARALVGRTSRRKPVQIYRRRGALPRGARQVPHGDFLAMLARRGVHVYAERASAASFRRRQVVAR